MHPILFQIGSITIYSYGFLIAVAVVICSTLLSRDAARQGIHADVVYDFVFWAMLGGIVGARLFYVALYPQYFSNPMEILFINHGGLAWQGGLSGGIISSIIFVRRRRLSLRAFMDLSAPYLALGQAIGRMGCFFNGCCYGRPWEHGIFFPVHNARLHPTQLYETAGLLAIFFILRFYRPAPRITGQVFVLYLWLAAIERFTVEFFRADHDVLWLGLSLFQYIAVGIFCAGIILFLRLKK